MLAQQNDVVLRCWKSDQIAPFTVKDACLEDALKIADKMGAVRAVDQAGRINRKITIPGKGKQWVEIGVETPQSEFRAGTLYI